MLSLDLEVEHVDHGRRTLTAGPAEIIRWETWAGRPITSMVGDGDAVNLGMTDLAFLAYAAIRRQDSAKLPPFEIWADGLVDLEMVDLDDPGPTRADHSGTP